MTTILSVVATAYCWDEKSLYGAVCNELLKRRTFEEDINEIISYNIAIAGVRYDMNFFKICAALSAIGGLIPWCAAIRNKWLEWKCAYLKKEIKSLQGK